MLAESVDNEMLKFPLRILVYGTLIFVVPTLALVSLVFIICPVDLAVKFLLVKNPMTVLFLVLGLVFPGVYLGVLNDKIRKNRDNTAKINSYIRVCTRVFLFGPIGMSLLFAVLIGLFSSGITEFIPYHVFVSFPVGATLVFSLFFHVLFAKHFDNFFSWCDVSSEYIALKFTVRNILISILSLIGVVAISISTLFIEMNMVQSSGLLLHFFTRFLPVLLVCVVVNFLTYLISGKSLSERISSIINLADSIAKRDYSIPALKIIARDEFGALAHDLNKKVASEIVNIVDDGTLDREWGSTKIDDEGCETKRNILIKDGVLVGYLVDEINTKKMNMSVTGSGRRESYLFAPTSRMNNTYLLPGNDSFEDMIKSIKLGVYCEKMSGGTVNPSTGDFNFAVDTARLIENGKLGKRIKGITLIGNSKDILKNVEMIADDLKLSAGYCGSKSGMIYVTIGQPTIKVSKILVGGKE